MASVIAASGFDLARQIAVMRLQTRMDMHIQPALIDRLLNLPSTFFRKFSSGDLTMRVLGVSQIKEILSSAVLTAVLGLLFGISNLFLLFYYSWQLALWALLMTTILVALTAWISYRQLSLNKEMLGVQGKISGLLGNLLTGIARSGSPARKNRHSPVGRAVQEGTGAGLRGWRDAEHPCHHNGVVPGCGHGRHHRFSGRHADRRTSRQRLVHCVHHCLHRVPDEPHAVGYDHHRQPQCGAAV